MSSSNIFQKISEGTVTADDFNSLINEATPEALRDRVRRGANIDTTRGHLDDDGHQAMSGPSFNARIKPKREKADNTQMQGGGKAAHRKSTRTQRRKARTESKEFLLTFDKGGYVNNLKEELDNRNIKYSIEAGPSGYVLSVDARTIFDDQLKEWLTNVGRAERLDIPKRDVFESEYSEGIKFIKENVGKEVTDLLVESVQNKQSLKKLATGLLSKPNFDRDWLYALVNSL